ncbi:MAG: hypothetical protein ACYDEV_04450 [Acidiferrobacter sp.]
MRAYLLGLLGPYPSFRGLPPSTQHGTVMLSYKTGKEIAMIDDEPDAIYYFQKAVEDLEEEMTGPVYYLARGLLRLAESLASQRAMENGTGAVDAPEVTEGGLISRA